MVAILNSAILDSTILHKKNFTCSFWLNLMMAAILKSAMLDSDTAILDSDILLSFLRFTQKYSHSTVTLTQTNTIRLKLIHSDLLNDGIHLGFSHFAQNSNSNYFNLTQTHLFSLNLMMAAILNSAIMDSAILHKKNFTHSFWLNLMMAAILNSAMLDSETAILDSDTFIFSLRFTQKHSHSILTLTQTISIWIKLIHSHLTWWWQPSWIQPFCSKFWLQLIQSDSNSFILIQLDDGSHLEFCHLEICHLGFSHLIISSQTHSHLPKLDPTIYTKKTSLIHSDSTWWWQPSWILPSWIQTPCFLLWDSLKNTLSTLTLTQTNSIWLKLINVTQLDDGSIQNSANLHSSILVFPLKLTHTCQDWFPLFAQKWISLIHSDSTWWWQPSWILPCWIQTLHSWIQTPCYLLSDSLKNTFTPLWLWLKLIQSDSNSFILT